MSIKYYLSKLIKRSILSSIKNSDIHKTSKIEASSSIVNTTMDKYSFCGYNCEISNCEIGSFVSIADKVIIGGGIHPMEWVGMSPVFYEGRDSVKKKFSKFKRTSPLKTIIGSDVWIGNNVLIKQGVKIGNGSVIGMGSVVTKDVPDYSIYAGIPAKLIRKRFDDNLITKLLEIEWWNFTDKKLSNYAKYFENPNNFVDNFLKENK